MPQISKESESAFAQVEGLSSATASRRLEEEGYNELPKPRFYRLQHLILDVLREPMVFLLVACGGVYYFIGDKQEALLLLGFILMIVGITVRQQRKADRALEALREYASPRALVLRDGVQKRIHARELVRSDILFLNEGDRVAADGLLISRKYLAIDEALLTGESCPVLKDPLRSNRIFTGTTVVGGQGIIKVTETGASTEFGKIGISISSHQKQTTRLETQTRKAVRIIAVIATMICVLVVIVYGITRQDWINGLLAGLTLAMAILPNELPAVLTIFLALGAWRISQRRVLTRNMPAIEDLGSATVLCVDKTGTLTLNRMALHQLYCDDEFLDLFATENLRIPESFHEVLEFGLLATRENTHDPMDHALWEAGTRLLNGTEHLHNSWSLEKEYPLSSELLSISQAWKPRGSSEYVVGAKGAPESILDLCHLDALTEKRALQAAAGMAEQGLRVIGVAKARVRDLPLPNSQHDFEFSFVGFLGLMDPIRPGVPEAVSECRSAGVRVIMITGDHPATARSIGKKIGLQSPDRVVSGAELNRMSQTVVSAITKEVNVFSRMVPEQKLRLVKSLRANGEIVAMTGDGVNDVPALKNANIGIAMGARGTDVAREASSLVLLDDDFGSIVEAIRMGRRVFNNLQTAVIYLVAIHVPIAGISVLPVFFELPLVLLPIHIAFLHLIIEPASSIVFEAEPAGPQVMHTPPRRPGESLFGKMVFISSLFQGGTILIAMVITYFVSDYFEFPEEKIRAASCTVLIVANLGLILLQNCFQEKLRVRGRYQQNKSLGFVLLGSLALLGAVLYIPSFRAAFRFSELHFFELIICIIVGILSVLVLRQNHRRSETA